MLIKAYYQFQNPISNNNNINVQLHLIDESRFILQWIECPFFF